MREASERSYGLRNTVAIVAFVVVFFWAAASAESRSVQATICDVFGKRKCAAALRVASCESHLNPRAVGSAGERGLFQIHPVHFGWAQPRRLFDPKWNSQVAKRLSRDGTDWRHWTCQP